MGKQTEEVADNIELLLREIEKRAREVIYRTRDDELYYFVSNEEMFFRARFLAYCESDRDKAKEQIFKRYKVKNPNIKDIYIDEIDYNLEYVDITLKTQDKKHILIGIYYPATELSKKELMRTYEIFQELLEIYHQKEEKARDFNCRIRNNFFTEWHERIDTTPIEEIEKLINRMSKIFKE